MKISEEANCEANKLIQDAAIKRERDNLPRDELPRRTQSLDGHALQTATARDLHARDGDALDIVARNDLGQLLGVIGAIKFRTADKANFVADEIGMEVAVRKCAAVGSDKQIGALDIRGLCRSQLNLHRPIAKLRGHNLRRGGSGGFIRAGAVPSRAVERSNSRSRTGDGRPAVSLRFGFLFAFAALNRRLVVSRCLALDKRDGASGTTWQTIAETVAEIIAHKPGLPVNDLNSSLVARFGANSAAVALLLVDLYDFANHVAPFVV